MADEEENENPLDTIREKADALGLEGDERDDYIEGRMRRAGYKKGPGDWISIEDDEDDEDQEDDDEPVTRGDIRRMRKSDKRKAVTAPPKKKKEEETKKPGKKGSGKNEWW